MLFNFIQIILPCITFIVGGYMGYKIYQTGYDDGRKSAGAKAPERRPVISFGQNKPIENDPYDADVMANIEAYDGTAKGQREVRSR